VETFRAEALRNFVARFLEAKGFESTGAAQVAEALVWANLRGIDSHGVVRIAQYLFHFGRGEINTHPRVRAVSETAATVFIDGDRSLGPVAMNAARDAALEKARAAGIGLALVRATTHTAALGHYTEPAARQGFAAIAMAAAPPQMAYQGARGRAVSTSPFSIAVPGEPEPIVFDMASSIVGLGRLLQMKKAGEPIPEGWATDEAGNPSTDPAKASVPLPVGGAKGSGLSLMIELLTGVLAGNPIIARALEQNDDTHAQNALVIAIDVSKFGSVDLFRQQAARLAAALKSMPRSDPGVEIRVPGERGARLLEKRSREGIPLPPSVVKELREIAAKTGVAFPS
jgi:LDH2 family malate/lactate/ureidoglycolate dehydrogenase